MTISTDVYYDPYDVAINADPYPVYRRLREEAPLYYNDVHDFYAVSRHEDVEKGPARRPDVHFGSRRHHRIDQGQRGDAQGHPDLRGPSDPYDPPSPPVRVRSRRGGWRSSSLRSDSSAPQCLDPLVGGDHIDFIANLGAEMPMRVIGMLLGIPEADQRAVRDHVDATLRTAEGKPMEVQENFVTGAMFGDYVDWRAEHPSDDIMTELLNVEFTDETGTVRKLHAASS